MKKMWGMSQHRFSSRELWVPHHIFSEIPKFYYHVGLEDPFGNNFYSNKFFIFILIGSSFCDYFKDLTHEIGYEIDLSVGFSFTIKVPYFDIEGIYNYKS